MGAMRNGFLEGGEVGPIIGRAWQNLHDAEQRGTTGGIRERSRPPVVGESRYSNGYPSSQPKPADRQASPYRTETAEAAPLDYSPYRGEFLLFGGDSAYNSSDPIRSGDASYNGQGYHPSDLEPNKFNGENFQRGPSFLARRTVPQLVLMAAALFFTLVFSSSYFSFLVFRQLDHRDPPIVFHDMKLLNTRIRSGEDLTISYTYDKRSECTPQPDPLPGFPDRMTNANGEFNYKVRFRDSGRTTSFRRIPDGRTANEDPAGIGMSTTYPIFVSGIVPPLVPGHYAIQFRAIFTCTGEKGLQTVDSPYLDFYVVP